MEQGGGVHELDGGREPHVSLAPIAGQLGCRDGQHGAKPLAARVDQMVGKLWNELDVGHRLVEDDPVYPRHLSAHEIEQRLQARSRIARTLNGDHNTQCAHSSFCVRHIKGHSPFM